MGRRGLWALLLVMAVAMAASASASASWTAGPTMLDATSGAGATLLHDGSVLVVGGNDASPGLSVNERLDPVAGRWSVVAPMQYQRHGLVLVTLHDGTALAVGGDDNATFPGGERYDPSADAWTKTLPLLGSGGRGDYPAVVVLPDGRALSIGGGHYDTTYEDTSIYDPATNQWTTPTDYPWFIRGNAATVLADGRVLSAGGRASLGDLGSRLLDAVYVYDDAANRWSPVASLPAARGSARAVTLHDGRVLLAGGDPDPSGLVYDPVADRWTATGPLPAGTVPTALTLLPDGRALAVGGTDPGSGTTSAALYDPATNGWTNAGPLLVQRGTTFTATALADGRVLVAGGEFPDRTQLSSTEIWSPTVTPPPPPPRCRHHHGHGCHRHHHRHHHRRHHHRHHHHR